MPESILLPSPTTNLTALLKQCKSLAAAKLLHQKLIVGGVLNPPATRTAIDVVSMYISSNAPTNAILALQYLPPSPSTVYWWNALIRRSISLGLPHDVLRLYRQMQRLGWSPDAYTFPYVLKAAGEIPSFRRGGSVHAAVITTGFDSNVFVCNAVVAMYGRCGALDNARQMFDEMSLRGKTDVVSWNSIVAAYVQTGDTKSALQLFDKMTGLSDPDIRPDAVSLVNVLPACASRGDFLQGKQIHGYAVRTHLSKDVFVGNAIVDMYAKCKLMDEANKFFGQMKVKDVVSWNSMVTGYSQINRCDDAIELFEKMKEQNIKLNVITWSAVISGYAQRGQGYEALDIFRQMRISGSEPNVVTLVSLLSACASVSALNQGRETHCYALKLVLNMDGNDEGDDVMVVNGLIDLYAKCKKDEVARRMFDDMGADDRNVVTWTVMIGGYAQHGGANDALELFSAMVNHNGYVKPNAFTVCCALMACARLASLRFGKQIHGYVLRSRYENGFLFVANCLIDMYAKSGNVDAAKVVFDLMGRRNEVSWTSLMAGYGIHGRGEEAVGIFNRMRNSGLKIDGVTFLVLLYACSHSGMVNKGIECFEKMRGGLFGVFPGVEHYASMVDLLGRAGRLEEATRLIGEMPMDPTPVVWVALLSACKTHNNVEVGEYAAEKLSELAAANDGSCTLLSNIYANARRWRDVARVRSLMKKTGMRKRPGCSWVQGTKETAAFFVGDRTHPLSEKIYVVLADLIGRIKDMGYVPETSFALHDVDDEEKSSLLLEHSEKLALAYGIITSPAGVPIRITKNLRICGDCHSAFTYISRIIEHEIILRDSSRFHHFKNGSCSCRGYW